VQNTSTEVTRVSNIRLIISFLLLSPTLNQFPVTQVILFLDIWKQRTDIDARFHAHFKPLQEGHISFRSTSCSWRYVSATCTLKSGSMKISIRMTMSAAFLTLPGISWSSTTWNLLSWVHVLGVFTRGFM